MTQQTVAGRPARLRQHRWPAGASGPPRWRPAWSVPAAARAARATIVVPSMLALTLEVIGNQQMALFAVFGSFGALVLSTFGGSRRDKAIAHLGLAVTGSIALIIGTLVSSSALLASLVTVPVTFCIYFGATAGPNAAAGVTAALLAYVLPVAAAAGAGTIPSRLAGWWLASVVSTAAVLTLSPRSAGDRLRQSAAALAGALAHHLQAAVAGTATVADRDASLAARSDLMALFGATPYRPVGLATADQALASLISLLEWCTALTCDAMDAHVDVSRAAEPDRELLADSAAALRVVAGLLDGSMPGDRDAEPSLERVCRARFASAVHLRGLTGDPAEVRRMADHAFHAQAIGIAASASAADALIATGRRDPDSVDALRRRWVTAQAAGAADAAGAAGAGRLGEPGGKAVAGRVGARRWRSPVRLPWRGSGIIAADANMRSVWFRNSARGALALAAAVAVARASGVQHGFWVVLGTLSVLRSSAGATGSTALRALAGTVAGFIIGAALMVGIGSSADALWLVLPLAVLVTAYAPGTAPFTVGQAAFTVTIIVVFNLLVPAGWKVGLVRVEDVAIGCAVSVVVGALFWPRGASALVGDNLADALRAGAAHLTEATSRVLGLPGHQHGPAAAAIAAGVRLDDAIRGYLTEQGSKRLARQDLWTLAMSALRLRLTAQSLASLPGLEAARGPAAQHGIAPDARATLVRESASLAAFYDCIAAQVSRPGQDGAVPSAVPRSAALSDESVQPCRLGPAHLHPEALWVRDHLRHLRSHSAELIDPAGRLAALRRRPWWR